MRIALLAPVALSVPPSGYGGTERVVHLLAEGLVARGHQVTLFASGDSQTHAELRACLPRAVAPLGADTRERYQPLEDRHAAWAFSQADSFEVIHDHTKTQGVLWAPRIRPPVITTLHNDFTPERRALYTAHRTHRYVAISAAQARRCPELNYEAVIHNGLDSDEGRSQAPKQDYLLFLGRMCEAKGTHTAIAVAQVLGMPLILAGKIDPVDQEYYDSQIAPHVDRERIRYVGEVSGSAKWDLLAGARCLLFPIQWPEPFGLVMIEAMAAGTPVVATRWGAVPEVVCHGVSGWIAEGFDELIEGVLRCDQLSPMACRRWVARHFSAQAMVDHYERLYERILREASPLCSSKASVAEREHGW